MIEALKNIFKTALGDIDGAVISGGAHKSALSYTDPKILAMAPSPAPGTEPVAKLKKVNVDHPLAMMFGDVSPPQRSKRAVRSSTNDSRRNLPEVKVGMNNGHRGQPHSGVQGTPKTRMNRSIPVVGARVYSGGPTNSSSANSHIHSRHAIATTLTGAHAHPGMSIPAPTAAIGNHPMNNGNNHIKSSHLPRTLYPATNYTSTQSRAPVSMPAPVPHDNIGNSTSTSMIHAHGHTRGAVAASSISVQTRANATIPSPPIRSHVDGTSPTYPPSTNGGDPLSLSSSGSHNHSYNENTNNASASLLSQSSGARIYAQTGPITSHSNPGGPLPVPAQATNLFGRSTNVTEAMSGSIHTQFNDVNNNIVSSSPLRQAVSPIDTPLTPLPIAETSGPLPSPQHTANRGNNLLIGTHDTLGNPQTGGMPPVLFSVPTPPSSVPPQISPGQQGMSTNNIRPLIEMDPSINARPPMEPNAVAEQRMKSVDGAPNSARGRNALLDSALKCCLAHFLVNDVLENSGLENVKDAGAVKVHSVELLQLLLKDPGYGMKFDLILNEIPNFAKYSAQDHGLFSSDLERNVDYLLTNSENEDMKMLKNGT